MAGVDSSLGSSSQPSDRLEQESKKLTADSAPLSPDKKQTLTSINNVVSASLQIAPKEVQKNAWRKVTSKQALASLNVDKKAESVPLCAAKPVSRVIQEVKAVQKELQSDAGIERHYEASMQRYVEQYPVKQATDTQLLGNMSKDALQRLLQEVKLSGHLEKSTDLLSLAATYVRENADRLKSEGFYEILRKEVVELGKTVDMLQRLPQKISAPHLSEQTVTNITRSKALKAEQKTDSECVQKLGSLALTTTQAMYEKLEKLPEKLDLRSFASCLKQVGEIQPHIQEFLRSPEKNSDKIECYTQCLSILSSRLTVLIETHKELKSELKKSLEQIEAVRAELSKDSKGKDVAELTGGLQALKLLQKELSGYKSDTIEYKMCLARVVLSTRSLAQYYDNCSHENKKSFGSDLKKEISACEKFLKQPGNEISKASLYQYKADVDKSVKQLLEFLTAKGMSCRSLDSLSIEVLDSLKATLQPTESKKFDLILGDLRSKTELMRRTYVRLDKTEKAEVGQYIQSTVDLIPFITTLDIELRMRGYEKLYQKCVNCSPNNRKEHEKDVAAFLMAMKNSASEPYRERYPSHRDEVYKIADDNAYELDL